MAAVHVVLLSLSLIPALACAYLALLTVLSGRVQPPAPANAQLRFDIIVPAHNEATGIARTIASLQKMAWPTSHYRVVVVADNCTDNTAEKAQAAGAEVWVRTDADCRGKGYALAYAFERSAAQQYADAVVFFDADTDTSANLLSAFAARIRAGADAVQADHTIRNPNDSWRTRLLAIAYGAFHIVRSRSRERLQVSCGLRGNGMCFTHTLLARVPYQAYSLAEDLEYGIDLGLQGVRVHYAGEAYVAADSVSSSSAASKQRHRWEGGRYLIMRQYTWPLFKDTLRRGSAVCLDLLADLLTPPLSQLALWITALFVISASIGVWAPTIRPWAILHLVCGGILAVHVLRGWQVSGTGTAGLRSLAYAPFFALWKVFALVQNRGNRGWVRTDRE